MREQSATLTLQSVCLVPCLLRESDEEPEKAFWCTAAVPRAFSARVLGTFLCVSSHRGSPHLAAAYRAKWLHRREAWEFLKGPAGVV